MATVREGNKGVLLVVDVQVGVMNEAWDARRIIGNVARAVERARAQGAPVIWVQHSDNELAYGTPEWQWVPELAPAEGEPLIHKRFNSSFEQTALEDGARGARRDPHRAGGSRDQLVHSCHGVWRTGPRLRPDADQGRAHHRHHDTRRRHEHRGCQRRPRAQHRDDLVELPWPHQRHRHGRGGRLRHVRQRAPMRASPRSPVALTPAALLLRPNPSLEPTPAPAWQPLLAAQLKRSGGAATFY